MYKCRWNINSWLFLLFSQYAAICLFQSLDTLFQSLNSRSGTQSPQNLHAYKLVYTVCIPLVFLNFIAEWCNQCFKENKVSKKPRLFCFIMCTHYLIGKYNDVVFFCSGQLINWWNEPIIFV